VSKPLTISHPALTASCLKTVHRIIINDVFLSYLDGINGIWKLQSDLKALDGVQNVQIGQVHSGIILELDYRRAIMEDNAFWDEVFGLIQKAFEGE
jgi:hypothetical protein